MPKIEYQIKRFQEKSLKLIALANEIIADFASQGFGLTLRQLYYQMVSRNVFPNNERSYDNLGALVSDARLAGLIDWDAIEDRTRHLRGLSHWNDPAEVVQSAAHSFHYDLWEDQPRRVEVWIEKDALVGVIQKVCNKWDVPFFSCRGYTSQSEMWGAAQRIVQRWESDNQPTTIIHLGDHDPSGIDMTRDIDGRLEMFVRGHGAEVPDIKRIALNMSQIKKYNPPPNPAKATDCRYEGYRAEYGENCWELDALSPSVIANMVDREIQKVVVLELFEAQQARQAEAQHGLQLISDKYASVVKFVNKPPRKRKKKKA